MTPRRKIALDYALDPHNQPQGRICYNFAPKRILSQLLMCGVNDEASESPQHLNKAPKEVSARFDYIDPASHWLPVEAVYPEPFLPYVRVLCIQAPDKREHSEQIPELFKYNNIYFNKNNQKMELIVN